MAVDVGQPSLPHMRNLRVSEIEIDRSFLAVVPDNEQDRAIVGSLIVLSCSLRRLLTTGVRSGGTSPTRWWTPCDHRAGMPLAARACWAEASQGFGARTAMAAGEPGFAELPGVAVPLCGQR